jgi:phosphatidylserine/phosphatidylglycerophosphate/cardiolipin synthase-like enzyme
VLDARLVLDEGEALDVSEMLDPVRLARVASRLQRAGFPVTAIVHRGEVEPLAETFATLTAAALEGDRSAPSFVRPAQAASASSSAAGNRIELELDNATARGWLLEAIARSTTTLHFQVYMALDDDVGGPVEAALAAAGARGVRVRVLVDSLHGLHGSFGARNPLLDRLSARPGVELRTLRPITELPSLVDLKQRDHRKLVVADGCVALLGGRNLSHEYYTAFDEVQLTPASPWRQVPWLDAGARVEGPAVALLEASFLGTWLEAGGAPFEIAVPPPAGASSARVVVHRGLRDARTLEAYLELIESARSHVYAVSGFPLVLELQHAFLRALRRGVRVRALLGHLTPMHAGQPFGGAWAAARTAATELVHSRMDPIIAAGGETYLFARHDVPGWAPELGVVHPHVHAKAMSVDGVRCAVGSANMDITASYWESEVLLVVEDDALARAFEARLDMLMAGSTLVRREDPAWQRLAERRAWMRHWPGVLSA